MLAWIAGLALAASASAPQKGADEIVLVDGRRYFGVVFPATPWQPGRTWIEGGGKGNDLFAERRLGAGDFVLRAKLAIAKKEATGCGLALGESVVGLDGEKGQLFTNGPLFDGRLTLIAESSKRIVAGKAFDLEARRTGDMLTVLVDGQPVIERAIGADRIGRFGIVPEKARVELQRFSVVGELSAAPVDVTPPDFQPAIDAAIDRGVTWLLARQLRDGSWQNDSTTFPGGQTALSTYTLIRSGLDAQHPSVTRGLDRLSRTSPHDTYTSGLTLMAFEASGDPAYRERMKAIVKDLLESCLAGAWSYAPAQHEGAPYNSTLPTIDLSNTQYAVLGLRAAAHAGLEVPDSAWADSITAVARLQEEPYGFEVPRLADKTGTATVPVAGFRYRPDRGATGSMTAAGVAVIQVCRSALGRRIKADLALKAMRALQLGTTWIDHHFNLERNFGDIEEVNHYYYLYGLERVGTLLEVESFGEHAWYPEGARWILKHQGDDGTWATRGFATSDWRQVQEEIDTCFAILFLKRASKLTVRTGAPEPRPASERDPTVPVQLRAFGRTTVSLWIGGFGESVTTRENGARVAAVEYLEGDAVIERVQGDPTKAWTDESYTVRHTFELPGVHKVRARVKLSAPEFVVESKTLEVASDGTLAPWMKTAAEARDRNLLLAQDVTAVASTIHAAENAAFKAADGSEATVWTCKADDTAPMLTLEWTKPVKADVLVLNGACSRRADLGKFDRITKISVRLNKDKEAILFPMGADEIEPTVLDLPKTAPIRRIEIKILERTEGGALKGRAGFTEVALEKRGQ